jgi:hypothetical protein
MEKPTLDLNQHDNVDFYTFVGRVGLLLIEHNVDAITVGTFLREIVEAGGRNLSREQAMQIANNYVQIKGASTTFQ